LNNLADSNPGKVLEMKTPWKRMLNEIREVDLRKSNEKQKVSILTENLK